VCWRIAANLVADHFASRRSVVALENVAASGDRDEVLDQAIAL
jgi:hypothetical protein